MTGSVAPVGRIELKEVRVRYGRDPRATTSPLALDGVTTGFGMDERIALVGRSGSGKSTLAALLGGLLPPSTVVEGSARVDGVEVVGASEPSLRSVRGRRLGFVFQDPHGSLNPVVRVGRQIDEVLRSAGVSRVERSDRTEELLAEVGLDAPSRVTAALPHELSGGMAQRVAIALALAGGPRMLIADEATTALDRPIERTIVDLLLRLADERGLGVLFVTHDLPLAARFTERLLVLEEGRLVDDRRAEEGGEDTVAPETRRLIEVASPPAAPASPPAAGVESTAPVLRVRDLVVDHGALRAVDGVDFDLTANETLAVIGSSGAGKSTMARAIVGAVASTGEITVAGEDFRRSLQLHPRRSRAHVQLLFQNPMAALHPRLRVGSAIREVLRCHGHPEEEWVGLLESVHLEARLADRFPHELSGGERQRMTLARALAVRPAILILDEPVTSLDPIATLRVTGLLNELKSSRGLSYVFIAHDLSQVGRIADRVMVLDRGRVVEVGETSEVLAGGEHPVTRGLVAAEPIFGERGTPWIRGV